MVFLGKYVVLLCLLCASLPSVAVDGHREWTAMPTAMDGNSDGILSILDGRVSDDHVSDDHVSDGGSICAAPATPCD